MSLHGPRPDANQVLQNIYDPTTNAIQVEIPSSAPITVTNPPGQSLDVTVINSLIPDSYDSIQETYWTSGNGVGQLETVQFYQGGLSGTLVATLTLNYDSMGRSSTVVRT